MMEKVILVTGATSDLGMEYIRKNIGLYDKVIAQYCHENEQFVQLLQEAKEVYEDRVIALQADFSKMQSVRELIDRIQETGYVPTHILHLVSPMAKSVKFHKSDVDEYRQMMQVSVYSIIEILKAFLPAMQKQKFGRIVFMLSAYVKIPDPKYAAPYVTAKYALLGLMRDIAAEYASKGITVNGISPQMIETKFLKDVPELMLENKRQAGPLQRLLQKEDILPVMELFLADGAAAITGENLGITGGNYSL